MSRDLSEDLSVLLRERGWSVVQENPSGSDLWMLDNGAEMYLPPKVPLGSFLWSDIMERIAAAHGESISDAERAVEMVRFDVSKFRVDGDQTVPLGTGATVIGSAFGMLRASATAARRPRQSIGSNYSKFGDEIVREARLAHTEKGSFVFPVGFRLSAPEPESQSPFDGEVFASIRPESSERRVMRTFAQAMAAFHKHVLEPANEPTSKALGPVIVAGGTKEMFAHLGKVLSEPDISWLETRFKWAPVEASAPNVPEAVTVPAEAKDLVQKSVRLLSQPKSEPLRVITGPIITISHVPGEPLGEIAIQSPSPSGRYGRVEAIVKQEQLDDMHKWMAEGTTVVLQGQVERLPGRPARLVGFATPQPLEDVLQGLDG